MPDRNIFRKILFCTDFSDKVDPAFRYAVNLAGGGPHRELVIFHVVPEPSAQFWKTYIYEVEDVDQKAKRDIDERIEKTYLVRAPKSVQIEVVIRVGKDSDSILEFAEENAVDLIVMGRRGRSSLGKVLFGNVTEKICRKAPCAVLIVPLSLKERKAKTQE
mgnify:CR=1 FL=1